MDDHFGHYVRMMVEVKTPTLNPLSQNPSPVEEISLKFTARAYCHHFQVAESLTATLVWRHKSRKLNIATHQLPISLFNPGEEGALQQHLSSQLERHGHNMDIKTIADEIMNRWVEIKEGVDLSMFGKVFPLDVTLRFINALRFFERPSTIQRARRMIPASNTAVEEMLKKTKIEEMEANQSCVICLEEMEEEKSAILQMPCLHVFHEECIKKWLKKSHSCPTCRFQMPTN